ncbi:hypothetical protein KM043_002632 [Ampulex compressa]|nr:hypothetical protein KM043_002632 [Ampulex compressa]
MGRHGAAVLRGFEKERKESEEDGARDREADRRLLTDSRLAKLQRRGSSGNFDGEDRARWPQIDPRGQECPNRRRADSEFRRSFRVWPSRTQFREDLRPFWRVPERA